MKAPVISEFASYYIYTHIYIYIYIKNSVTTLLSSLHFHISPLLLHTQRVPIQSHSAVQPPLCSRLVPCHPTPQTCAHVEKTRPCTRNANITPPFCSQKAGMTSGQLDDFKPVNRQQKTKLGSDMLLPTLVATKFSFWAIAVFWQG